MIIISAANQLLCQEVQRCTIQTPLFTIANTYMKNMNTLASADSIHKLFDVVQAKQVK